MIRLLTAIMLFLGDAAATQDHLEPEDSVYQGRAFQDDMLIGYDIDVVRKFEEFFAGGFGVRAIILPSFETEYGVGVTYDKDDPILVGLRADAKLWYYSILREYDSQTRPKNGRYEEKKKEDMRELRASLPPRIEDVKLKRCEMPLSAESHATLTILWRTMLYGVRYPPTPRFGLDGISYHYSGVFDRQTLAGKIWSPRGGTRLERFTRMTEALYAACAANDSEALSAAISEATSICEEIKCAAG